MRDPALTRLYVGTFLYSFSHALGVPLVSEHLELTFRASLAYIGIVMGLYGVMQIVLRLPMGDMADRRGRKPSLLIAFAATVASGILFAFGPTKWWSVPAILLFGFAGGVYWVAANSYLFDRASPPRSAGDPGGEAGKDDVAKATSDYTIAMSLAFLTGPPIGHLIADHYGFAAAFLVYAASSLAGFVLMLTLPETPPAPRPRPATSSYRRALKLLRHPALVLSAMGTFTYSVLFSTQQSFFQLHVLSLGLGVTMAGLLLGGRQASALLVRIGLPRFLRRVGPGNVLVGGIVVLATATALVPFATTLTTLILLVAFAGAATGVLIPANLMLVHEGAPRDERGLANGIYGTMLGLGSAFAPFAFGALGAKLGLGWTFWGAAMSAFALVLFITLYRTRTRPAATPATEA